MSKIIHISTRSIHCFCHFCCVFFLYFKNSKTKKWKKKKTLYNHKCHLKDVLQTNFLTKCLSWMESRLIYLADVRLVMRSFIKLSLEWMNNDDCLTACLTDWLQVNILSTSSINSHQCTVDKEQRARVDVYFEVALVIVWKFVGDADAAFAAAPFFSSSSSSSIYIPQLGNVKLPSKKLQNDEITSICSLQELA